jgi:homoserine dehydrogenase
LPEPSLGGGVPIISTLQQDLVANHVLSMVGILSGNSNFLLSEMTRKRQSLKSVVKSQDAMKLAESLSVIDYEGSDAAQKVSILAAAAFGIDINYMNIHATGISEISVFDIECADEFGFEIKLLAILKEHEEAFEIHVHPTLVPKSHPLTLIRGDQNAYFLETDLMGEYMIYGRGVGVEATSSIILRDLVGIGNLLRHGASKKSTYRLNWNNKPVMEMDDISSAYYIRFPCFNQAGVVGKITTAMGEAGINLASAHAEVNDRANQDIGYVHVLVDDANESAINSAIKKINKMEIIKGQIKFYRILRSAE